MALADQLKFLAELKKNNNRDWFLSQKARYEDYKKDYHALIAKFLDVLKPGDPALERLEVKNCTFRINRDIRFSKDKSPYKTHMGLWFNTNSGHANGPGYYVHLEKGKSFIAGGFYQPTAEELKKFRKEIAFFHDELEAVITSKDFKSVFGDLNREDALKTAPKGFEKDHPAIEFLKMKSFTASAPLSDKDLSDKDFVEKTAEKMLTLKPLNDFLNRALEGE